MPFLRSDMQTYYAKKESIDRDAPDYEKQLEDFKSGFRGKIINALDSDCFDIETRHLALSQALGLPLGLARTFNSVLPVPSTLDFSSRALDAIRAGKYPESNCAPSAFLEKFLFFLNVWPRVFTILSRQGTIPWCCRLQASFLCFTLSRFLQYRLRCNEDVGNS